MKGQGVLTQEPPPFPLFLGKTRAPQTLRPCAILKTALPGRLSCGGGVAPLLWRRREGPPRGSSVVPRGLRAGKGVAPVEVPASTAFLRLRSSPGERRWERRGGAATGLTVAAKAGQTGQPRRAPGHTGERGTLVLGHPVFASGTGLSIFAKSNFREGKGRPGPPKGVPRG